MQKRRTYSVKKHIFLATKRQLIQKQTMTGKIIFK